MILSFSSITTIIALAFSFCSLVISITTFFNNKETLNITWDENIKKIDSTNILANDIPNFINSNNIYYTCLYIVNSSPHDIGFFDLRSFNPKTNSNHYLLTRNSLDWKIKDAYLMIKDDQSQGFNVEIPEKNYGIFKAKSFTRIYLLVIRNEIESDTINISFKIPKRSILIKDKFAVTNRKKYRFYGISYN